MALSDRDLEWIWAETAHAMRGRTPLPESLAELARANADTARGRMMERLAQSVASGITLSQAVATEGNQFPRGSAAALEGAEKTSRVPEALLALADGARDRNLFRFSIAQVVTYPLLIGFAALAIIIFIRGWLVPMFMKMFNEMNVMIPLLTLAMPVLLEIVAVLAIILPAAMLIFIYVLPRRPAWLAPTQDYAAVRFPIIGRVVGGLLLSRWCGALNMYLQAGLPEPVAVRLAGETSGNRIVRSIANQVGDRLEQGRSLSNAMTDFSFFPPQLTWMVAASEKAGGHRHVWPIAQDLFYDQATRGGIVVSIVLRSTFFILAVAMIALTVAALFLPLITLMNSMGA